MKPICPWMNRVWPLILPAIPMLVWWNVYPPRPDVVASGALVFAYGVALALAVTLFRLDVARLTVMALLVGGSLCIDSPYLTSLDLRYVFVILSLSLSLILGRWKWCLLYVFIAYILGIAATRLSCAVVYAGYTGIGKPLKLYLGHFAIATYVPLLGIVALNAILDTLSAKCCGKK